MKLIPIPKNEYEEYRLSLMFDCYKWDPQFLDKGTVARYALVITEQEHKELAKYTEDLDKETRAAEEYINKHHNLVKLLKLPGKLLKEIRNMGNYNPEQHIRLMRYDFHPVIEGGWAVSEVNSDVPGGFAEASLMPGVAITYLNNASDNVLNVNNTSDFNDEKEFYSFVCFGDKLLEAVKKKVPANGKIMLVHCTSYSDDRQVMQFLGDRLERDGYQVIYCAGEHLNFKDKKAYSILDGNQGNIDAIFRFTPLEWLVDIKPKRWQGYFNTETVSCNHPIAIFAQTKRFPLVWDMLEAEGINLYTWKKLLPQTMGVKSAISREGYVFKPVYGRVGDGISIKEALDIKEYEKILKDVKRHPRRYVEQKRFNSKPLVGKNGEEYHVCLGSYAVDGCHAGYYARISNTPRIDSNAADIPVLITRG